MVTTVEAELLRALADHVTRTARGGALGSGPDPRAVLDANLGPRDVSLREYLTP